MGLATRRRRGGIGLEATLTLVAILVALGWMARSRPIVLDPVADQTRIGPAPQGDTGADVLVVIPAVPEARTLDQLSHDQAWLNVVEGEVGPYRIVDTSQLSRSVMDPCAWVLIPKRAASQLDPTQTQFVRNWVEDGGVVFLEQPEGPWRGLIGQPLAAGRGRDTRRITSFDGSLSRGEMRADILEMPLTTTLLPYNPSGLARGRDYQVLLEVDGQPGVVSLHLGRGQVILLLFDFGRAAVHMTQGLPADDFTLRYPEAAEGESLDDLPPRTSALVSDDELRGSEIPFVDLLQRNLLYLADTHRPVPRLWAYPSSRRGALLVAHGESRYGRRLEYMTDWEHDAGHRSTVFGVADSLTPEALARLGRTDIDVQLQWIPTGHPAVPLRRWGLRDFRPVRRPMNLGEQVDALNHGLIPYGPVVASRSLDGHWVADWVSAFRGFDAVGILLDTSYGAAPGWASPYEDDTGYQFGTGRPFRPLDTNGNRFLVRELPTSVDATARGYSIGRVRQLIVDASEGYHTTIAGDWRPDVMARRPSYDALEGWRRAYELSASQELWVTTVADYVDFLARREASTVSSTFSREERRLTIEVRAVGPTRGDAEAVELTPSAAFPARFEGRPVERLIVDGASAPTSSLGLTGDRVLHILPLEPGEHRVQVLYGSPIEAPPQ